MTPCIPPAVFKPNAVDVLVAIHNTLEKEGVTTETACAAFDRMRDALKPVILELSCHPALAQQPAECREPLASAWLVHWMAYEVTHYILGILDEHQEHQILKGRKN